MLSATVACNGCTACCHGDIRLSREWGDAEDGIMPQNADGSCSHLCESGCGIYERRPSICRAFDCRAFARLVDEEGATEEVTAIWPAAPKVIEAGRARNG